MVFVFRALVNISIGQNAMVYKTKLILKLQNKPRRWMTAATGAAAKRWSRKTRWSRLWTVGSWWHLSG